MKSYKTIFDKYYNVLFAYANRMIKDPESAKEITNDTFLKLWEYRDRLDTDVDSLKPYLFQIAHNHSINHLKKIRINSTFEFLDSEIAEPFEQHLMEYRELEQAIDHAIDSLPEQRRQIFLLSRKEGLKYSEIAEQLGISPRTVETQIRRSLHALKSYLKKI
ncbi:RNA polymerase sigma-70 factor [Echinicola sp. CAU 1574]|uniref:RNA polymerase sigma-70 factor n=1 Tax=Echinicola arenosa TaxID=2774144 RepID=A0ABR9ALD6_9BACT|nr:RNA polymerase sigma-70 factor [Echinicola arenosa]MBD8489156.1 RNA polymerase sigma-70 factor [Echinicola arenosa]